MFPDFFNFIPQTSHSQFEGILSLKPLCRQYWRSQPGASLPPWLDLTPRVPSIDYHPCQRSPRQSYLPSGDRSFSLQQRSKRFIRPRSGADPHHEILVSKFERKKLAKVRTKCQKEKYFEKIVYFVISNSTQSPIT